MAEPQKPEDVKLIVAALWASAEALEHALSRLGERWGEVDYVGPDHAFDTTHYYESEMGSGLHRRIVSFKELVGPETLVAAKHWTNEVEDSLRSGEARGRRVNLDVGVLDHNKVVLASFKAAGQKIYLGGGVYADLQFRYGGGTYRPLEWTFPDYRAGSYDEDFAVIRKLYMGQRAEGGVGGVSSCPV